MRSRAINWLESTSRSIRSCFPEVQSSCDLLTERLSALLLERLPPQISVLIYDLLPEVVVKKSRVLEMSASRESDRTIGYSDFVERTMHALGCAEHLQEDFPLLEYSERIADAFLWAVVQEIPADIKIRMLEVLPLELSSRMNLYCAEAEDSKVA